MEIEFDKEIDAILRTARHTGSVAASSPHLDADVISAFAENALPMGARSLYVQHLADCDPCRKILSQTISISDNAAETAVAVPITAAAAEASVPWYKAIFRTPNLAVAMGGLILVFSGVLGFLVMQNNRDSENTVVSQVTDQEVQPGGPSFTDVSEFPANSNVAMQAASDQLASANSAAASPVTAANTVSNTSVGTTMDKAASKPVSEAAPAPATDMNVTARQLNELPLTLRQAAPAGVVLDGVTADEAKKDAETRQAERSDASLAAKRKETDVGRSRDLPPAAAKSGIERSGPVQMQSNQNSRNAVQMTATRNAGGRKFTNRDGAWYDTAYNGQATTNVRRGTEDFKKLDSGLRSIADKIDGVVVVVWKLKAYRIQ
ncbi:hypothetical protein BH20ACI2_BH20ACI2_13120 [soil metagenome]